jgi:hypothetical protein
MPILGKVLDAYPKSTAGYSVDAYSTIFLILLGTSLAALVCTFLMKETFPAEAPDS